MTLITGTLSGGITDTQSQRRKLTCLLEEVRRRIHFGAHVESAPRQLT